MVIKRDITGEILANTISWTHSFGHHPIALTFPRPLWDQLLSEISDMTLFGADSVQSAVVNQCVYIQAPKGKIKITPQREVTIDPEQFDEALGRVLSENPGLRIVLEASMPLLKKELGLG